jgi:hypothetical protein
MRSSITARLANELTRTLEAIHAEVEAAGAKPPA